MTISLYGKSQVGNGPVPVGGLGLTGVEEGMSMEEIIVIGHKNPDTDSVCSAYCYAQLKNRLTPQSSYRPARCGTLNQQTRFVFERLQLKPPRFIKDVYAKVADVMSREVRSISVASPVMEVVENIEKHEIRLTPVLTAQGRYAGIVSIMEVADFLMSGGAVRPVYQFEQQNFSKVLPGSYLLRGRRETFRASLVVGAMPYERFVERVSCLSHSESLLVVGERRDVIRFAIDHQFAAIVLTGFRPGEEVGIDFSDYQGTVFISDLDTAATVRQIVLSVPAASIMNTRIPAIKENDYLEEIKALILKSGHRGFPVVDEQGYLSGIVTRSDLLRRVSKQLILMDHNELSQAVDGAEKAEICEIIDHHRLGTAKTKLPVYFYAKPVGSTCTLVYQLYKINQVEIEEEIAALLLSGIMADTVILKSPTTTAEDVAAVAELSEIAGLDHLEYGREVFSSADNLKDRNPDEVINADFKVYADFGLQVGIGQVEIVSIRELDESFSALLAALKAVVAEKRLDWGMLLVTDIISGRSQLISYGLDAAEPIIAYRKLAANLFDLPGVLSRKKQLLPEILRVLEELKS